MECIRIGMSNYNSPMNLAAKASSGLCHGGAAGRAGRHGRHAGRGDADLVAHDSAREGRGAGFPRHPIRARHQPVSAQIRERIAGRPRRPDRTAHAAKEIQRPAVAEQRRRISDAVSADTQGAGLGAGQAASVLPPVRQCGAGAGRRLSRQRRSALRRLAASSASRARTPGQSIMVYKGKTRYNEWQFVGMEHVAAGWRRRRGWRRGPSAVDAATAAADGRARRSRRQPRRRSAGGGVWRIGGVGGRGRRGQQPARGTRGDPSPQR